MILQFTSIILPPLLLLQKKRKTRKKKVTHVLQTHVATTALASLCKCPSEETNNPHKLSNKFVPKKKKIRKKDKSMQERKAKPPRHLITCDVKTRVVLEGSNISPQIAAASGEYTNER